MDLTSALLTCADAYCATRKIARPTLSGYILKDSRALDHVANGRTITIRTYERCLDWLSQNWPADLAWPEGIDRPEKTAPRQDVAA